MDDGDRRIEDLVVENDLSARLAEQASDPLCLGLNSCSQAQDHRSHSVGSLMVHMILVLNPVTLIRNLRA